MLWLLKYAQLDIKNCILKFKDGDSNELTVKVGEGNVTYDETKNRIYYKDRGKLDTVRDGDEEPVDVKLDFTWEFLTSDGGSTPTVEEALKKTGNAASWQTSSEDECEPYAIDIEITYNPPCDNVKNEVILLSDFRYEKLSHDVKNAVVSVTGKCNITEAGVSRTAVSTNT